ncbi:MAG: tRNA (adenosine(37)-N6)-threonylcarbamoyltransferase complex dimerization subunit type 1 TsaB [Dehalococcoidia bacterium]|nr:tRNA (adenosine(37)-N6)-threonylcarbamoyltransferase complex dimerization subunit type 1 TsaB [Dehalococcoidia bacterium]
MSRALDLGIDTASDDIALALLEGDVILAERRWHVAQNVSLDLLGGLDTLLRDASAERDELARIAVDIGPGGYGGLRAGVATAQGMAIALDVPLAGVVRLEVDAYPLLVGTRLGAPVVAVHDAGRSGIAWAAYALRAANTAPETVVEPRIGTPEECAAAAPAGTRWAGELTEPLLDALVTRGRAGEVERDTTRASGETGDALGGGDAGTAHGRSAVDLVRLARLHEAYGDPAGVDVVYLRPPPITRPNR